MSGMNGDLEYFRGAILNPEADSLPLPTRRRGKGNSMRRSFAAPCRTVLRKALKASPGKTGLV